MSEFVAGFAARHDAAAMALRAAFALPADFAPFDVRARAVSHGPVSFAPEPGPRHFTPADPGGASPTAGWDPLDAAAESAGFIDPLEAAHAAGYEEGLAAAAAAQRAETARDQAFGSALSAELATGGRIDRERVARQLRQTVLYLVAKLVGETGVAPDLLAKRIDAASDMLADANESAMLRVHPDDVPLLADRLPKSLFAVGDPSLKRGSFVLESASTVIEDGPDLWLEQLGEAIERVSVPSC